jgi:hydrogenase maturation factor HypF (carbamoyltransferase family)
MVPTLEFAARLGVVGPLEQRLLSAPENPIVLIDHHPLTSSSSRELGQAEEPGPTRYSWRIAPEVAPRLSSLGVFLPTTPLHHLLLAQLDDIYATVQRQAYFILFEKTAHEMIAQGATVQDLATMTLVPSRIDVVWLAMWAMSTAVADDAIDEMLWCSAYQTRS